MTSTRGSVLTDNSNEDGGVPIIGIGASAGGLEALREMLGAAEAPTGLAFVVVQHLDPTHESMLAQLLDRATKLDVLQCEGGEQIFADRVYIIPPGRGLAIEDGRLVLTDFAQPRGLRRPIDDFFVSLANDQQGNAACVILSGTGADGSTGLRAIKEHGGISIAQRPDTARYDGMPTAAVGTGLIDFVRPPEQIIECLLGFFGRNSSDDLEDEAGRVADHVDDLCTTLRKAVGHDFSGYKKSTFVRRVERRMHVLSITSGKAYVQRLRSDPSECEALFRDLLINVTRFFRDSEMFDALRAKVIEPLLRSRHPEEDIRVWVPGCSSGEEAYTIAMLFAQTARNLDVPNPVQIFASDIDEQMLQVAREGCYPTSSLGDLPPLFQQQYTIPHGDHFTIAGHIRDLIRFSNHSVVRDPPFSRIDLVSCRNLLIYFDDRLQQSVMPLLHYAIRPGGYLFLGPSESIGRFDQLFPAIDHHARIFERSEGGTRYPLDLPMSDRTVRRRDEGYGRRSDNADPVQTSEAVNRLAERYAPPSMILNQDGLVLAAYGKLARYFDFPVTRTGGVSAFNLARPGLRESLGPLLRQSRDTGRRTAARNITVVTDFGTQPIEVICEPLADKSFLVVYRETGAFNISEDPGVDDLEAGGDHMDALEEELRLTRHKLRSAVEELETANEELKSSNEEMMSMNEELQSTNEELSTVNDELKHKVEQLTVANADVRNFFESTDMAVIVVDHEMRIRSFTEAAVAVFPIQASDRGRPLADVSTRLADSAYLEDAQSVAASGQEIERQIHSKDGQRTYALRVLPYRTQKGDIDGATLVLTDITRALQLQSELAVERERLKLAAQAGSIGVFELCAEDDLVVLDDTNRTLLGLTESAINLDTFSAAIDLQDRERVLSALQMAVSSGEAFEQNYRVWSGGKERHLKSFAQAVAGSAPVRLIGATIDVTPELSLAENRAMMLREMNHRVKNLFAIVSGLLAVAARTHDDVKTYCEDVRDRISALGRAHSLASPSGEQQAVRLRDLVDTTLEAYAGQAGISIEGSEGTISSDALSAFALILHEWTVNAAKYGALRTPQGKLSINWTLADHYLTLFWRETSPSPLPPQSKGGFGTVLVNTSVRQLDGELKQATGVCDYNLTLRLPESVLE
ncbi:chemotaxis protein CheB [Novosphingobium sp. ZW T3_23]|uniref:chemotaxis protein CheB n=1 Tax=Novosphingobium sp. ZW T3_23 TaxID=3378084 RepID=UPI003852EEE6